MKKLMIFFVILAMLAGYFYYFEYRKGIEKKKRAQQESEIFNFNKDDVVKIELKNDKGSVVFEKGKSNMWYITSPEESLADNKTVKQILSGFSCVYKKETIGKDVDLSKYELDKSFTDLTFYLKNGTKDAIHIGDATPSGDCNYAQKDKSNEVVLICSSYMNLISRAPFEYMNKNLWCEEEDFVKNNLEKVIVQKGDKSFSVHKDANGKWVAVDNEKAEPVECNAFVSFLISFDVSKFIKAASGHMKGLGLINPRYKIYLYCKGAEKPLTLDVGNYYPLEEIVWVKTSACGQIAALSKDFLTNIENLYK